MQSINTHVKVTEFIAWLLTPASIFIPTFILSLEIFNGENKSSRGN